MNTATLNCLKCHRDTATKLVLTPDLPHYGKLLCAECGMFRGWAKKPDSEATKYQRPKMHQNLVAKYSRGYCELCLKLEAELDRRAVLEAHHVIEFHDAGDPSRANVWILCTPCHRLVTWMRKYVGHNAPLTDLVAEVAQELTKDVQD